MAEIEFPTTFAVSSIFPAFFRTASVGAERGRGEEGRGGELVVGKITFAEESVRIVSIG